MRQLFAAIMAMLLLAAAPGALGEAPLDVPSAIEYSGAATCYANLAIWAASAHTNNTLIEGWTDKRDALKEELDEKYSWWKAIFVRHQSLEFAIGELQCMDKFVSELDPDLSESERIGLAKRNLRRAEFSLERAGSYARRAIAADAANEYVVQVVNEARIAFDEAVEETEKKVNTGSIFWIECSLNLDAEGPRCKAACRVGDDMQSYESCYRQCGSQGEAQQLYRQCLSQGGEDRQCLSQVAKKRFNCAKDCHRQHCRW